MPKYICDGRDTCMKPCERKYPVDTKTVSLVGCMHYKHKFHEVRICNPNATLTKDSFI